MFCVQKLELAWVHRREGKPREQAVLCEESTVRLMEDKDVNAENQGGLAGRWPKVRDSLRRSGEGVEPCRSPVSWGVRPSQCCSPAF